MTQRLVILEREGDLASHAQPPEAASLLKYVTACDSVTKRLKVARGVR